MGIKKIEVRFVIDSSRSERPGSCVGVCVCLQKKYIERKMTLVGTHDTAFQIL